MLHLQISFHRLLGKVWDDYKVKGEELFRLTKDGVDILAASETYHSWDIYF